MAEKKLLLSCIYTQFIY